MACYPWVGWCDASAGLYVSPSIHSVPPLDWPLGVPLPQPQGEPPRGFSIDGKPDRGILAPPH